MSLATPNQRPYAQSARLKLLHVSSRCRPSVESIESAHESSPINNAVEAAMSLDVMLIVIEIVSLRCRNTCVASRIKFSIGQAVGHRLVSYPIIQLHIRFSNIVILPYKPVCWNSVRNNALLSSRLVCSRSES